jgi:hypothetical protein
MQGLSLDIRTKIYYFPLDCSFLNHSKSRRVTVTAEDYVIVTVDWEKKHPFEQ